MTNTLRAIVDGAVLPDDEARSLWQRFSDWMEEHRGDLGGFAAKEGFASVHPGVENGKPVLLASRTAVQRPYAPASSVVSGSPNRAVNSPQKRDSGGSAARQKSQQNPRSGSGKSKK